MNNSEKLFEKLKAIGAGEFAHLNGSLSSHLRGTESLLREWDAREQLCNAGLYHAVYGTDGYNPSLVGLDMRQRIADLIGEEAEGLAYLYGACNRAVFYPRIGTDAQLLFVDRFSNNEYEISPSELADLCELILANELEIAQASVQFRKEHGEKLAKFFERMKGVVSDAGFHTFQSVLG